MRNARIMVLALCLSGCVSLRTLPAGAQSIRTAAGTLSVPGTAFINGRLLDAAPVGTMRTIKIWTAVSREHVACRLPHGAAIELLQALHSNEEQRYYFKIRGEGCSGWVAEDVVSRTPHEPVGNWIN